MGTSCSYAGGTDIANGAPYPLNAPPVSEPVSQPDETILDRDRLGGGMWKGGGGVVGGVVYQLISLRRA